MSNHKTRFSLSLAFALCLAQLARAQGPPGAPAGADPISENLFPPELVMQNQSAIQLSEEQKAFVLGEMQKAQSRFTELQWQLHEAMEKMDDILQQDPIDEAGVIAQLDQILAAERDIKRTQITLLIRIKNHLDPEQRDRLRELRRPR